MSPRVLVVGGASGIGLACVHALVAAGSTVVVADRAPVDDGDGLATGVRVDVRDADRVRAAIDELTAGGGIDAVVYAAGTGRIAALLDMEPSDWQLVLDVNLTGAFNVVRAAAPHLPRGGAIVLISSIDATSPVAGLAAYCAAKAGLDAFSRSVALELGPRGIRCNVVSPGVVRTPLVAAELARPGAVQRFVDRTPLGGVADAEQIATVVAFLVSPGAAWITGARVPVDGGMSLVGHPPESELNGSERG
jgi:NAD(P)-dependent dehydrogenase (short-subunit alcohol dehydrogenase family)